MPDGDRFERALRGPWRRAYRLSFDSGSADALRDVIRKSVAATLRTNLDPNYVRQIPSAIFQALIGGSSFDGFVDVLNKLDWKNSEFAGKELAQKAAKAVFIELKPLTVLSSLASVETRFSQELVERNIRHSFFAPAREGIASGSGRTAEEESKWESGILSALSNDSKTMLKPIFKSAKASIRAPRRTTPQRRMTLEELNKGLVIEK